MSNSVRTTSGGVAPNARRLLGAGFMAILAAGIGFGIRGGILANWAAEFGFTGAQLGAIGGAGFTGFCFGIIIGGVVVDKIGYGKLIVAAFLFHMLSALVTFGATTGQAQGTAYMFLYIGTFLFALANGTLEAVANPLVSTLFPENRTHYLNILHASWPAGLVLGGLVGWILGDGMHLSWKLQLGLFLVPTALYGVAFLGQKFPKSEASAKGLSIGEMLQEVGLLGALVACVLVGLFFKDQLGAVLAFFTGSPFFTSAAWGYLAWGVAFGLADRRRHQDEFLDRIAAALRALHHARAARLGRARHRRLDSEHHRQHPDAGARQDPVRLHLAADVLAALLRALHREAPEGLARSACSSSAPCWPSSACEWSAASTRSSVRWSRSPSTRSARRSSGRPCWPSSAIVSRGRARSRCRSWAASA